MSATFQSQVQCKMHLFSTSTYNVRIHKFHRTESTEENWRFNVIIIFQVKEKSSANEEENTTAVKTSEKRQREEDDKNHSKDNSDSTEAEEGCKKKRKIVGKQEGKFIATNRLLNFIFKGETKKSFIKHRGLSALNFNSSVRSLFRCQQCMGQRHHQQHYSSRFEGRVLKVRQSVWS